MSRNTNNVRAWRLLAVALLVAIGAAGIATAQNNTTLKITPGSVQFGTTEVGDSKTKSITIRNIGRNSVAVSLVLASDVFTVDGSTSFTLGAGASQSVSITYAPTEGDVPPLTDTATLRVISGGDTASAISVSLRGFARDLDRDDDGEIEVSPTSIDFGTVDTGSSATRMLTVTNTDDDSATITVIGPDDPFSIVSGGGTFTLAGDSSRAITVGFSPDSSGTFNDTILVVSGSDTIYVSLTGIGRIPVDTTSGDLVADPDSLAFGGVDVGDTATLTVTLENTDADTATVYLDATSLGAPFSLVGGSDTISVAPGDSLVLTVEFVPTDSVSYGDTLVIGFTQGSDTVRQQITIPVSGNGIDTTTVVGGSVAVDPDSLAFGGIDVGSADTLAVTLTNDGTDTATVYLDAATLGTPFNLIGGSDTVSVAPGDSLVLTVEFVPSDSVSYSDTLVIGYTEGSDTVRQEIAIAISGNGVDTTGTGSTIANGGGAMNSIGASTDVRDVDGTLHRNGVALTQVRPNPVVASATVSFTLPRDGHATLDLFDVRGEKVLSIVNEQLPTGSRNVTFDTSTLESGIYFYRLTVDGVALTQQITVAR